VNGKGWEHAVADDIRLKKGAAYQVVDGQIVTVSPTGEKVYLLHPAALPLWRQLEKGVDSSSLGQEEISFVAYLAAKGLLETSMKSETPATHPWVLCEEDVEVLAALCASAFHGSKPKQGKCRVFGSCKFPFE
jgi:hypothetical protein